MLNLVSIDILIARTHAKLLAPLKVEYGIPSKVCRAKYGQYIGKRWKRSPLASANSSHVGKSQSSGHWVIPED